MSVRFKNFVVEKNKVHPVNIQVEILKGMPDFEIIGLSDRSIREAKERARAAIKNNGYKFPIHRKIVNLTPASLKKTGTHFDLSIILGLLIKSGQVIHSPRPDTIFLGEVDLDGNIQRVQDILRILDEAIVAGVKTAYIPTENLKEAYLVKDLKIIPVCDLKNLINKLNSNTHPEEIIPILKKKKVEFKHPTFDDIINQEYTKNALTLAVAGRHSVLLIGPPGGGKSMLAESCKNLMPYLSKEEAKDYLKILNTKIENQDFPITAPFAIVHGNISKSNLLINKKSEPGILPAMNNGALVINELHEVSKPVLEALKEPMETRVVSNEATAYQCNTILIATMNPCRCGYNGDPNKVCYCTNYSLKLFRQKISGPLLDRFDIAINLTSEPVSEKVHERTNYQETNEAFTKILKARKMQKNISEDLKSLMGKSSLDAKSMNLIKVIERKYNPSTRRLLKILQVARTIAYIQDSQKIKEEHLAESINLQKFFLTNEWTKD